MKSSYSNNNARRLVILGLFIALIIIQSWVPFLGFITIGPIAMTIIPITVILSTLWLGTTRWYDFRPSFWFKFTRSSMAYW